MQNKFKGIILAGGSGTRLYPVTIGASKQILPIYDKPMIYYPLSVLMLAGIREILIISTLRDIPHYKRLLGNGSDIGLIIKYVIQPNPDGIAQAFILGESFIGQSNVALILGDNIFYGKDFLKKLKNATSKSYGATIFGYKVKDPERFGVIEFDTTGKVLSIEEKPSVPKSNFAITGLYFYDNNVIKIAKNLKPSHRGELEITDVNRVYQFRGDLNVELFSRDFRWLDSGTHDSLLEASIFIKKIEKKNKSKVGCLEEIAFINGWISKSQLLLKAEKYKNNSYSNYLFNLIKD